MTVAELIEKLQTLPPDLVVVGFDGEWSVHFPITRVNVLPDNLRVELDE